MEQYTINKDVDITIPRNCRCNYQFDYRFPNVIDHRDFCLPTDNQYDTPHCVGYTVAGFLEIHNWMRTSIPKQLDAGFIYRLGREYKCESAKGTKIEYCLEELKKREIFCGDICFLHTDLCVEYVRIANFKRIIHQYGSMMCAFNISNEWFKLDKKYVIKTKKNPRLLGGHCVLCCGYCPEGIYIQNSWGYENWGNYGFGIVPWKMVYNQLCYGVYIKDFKLNINNLTELYANNC